MYLMPNEHLKVVKMGNFILCIFYNNKKKERKMIRSIAVVTVNLNEENSHVLWAQYAPQTFKLILL